MTLLSMARLAPVEFIYLYLLFGPIVTLMAGLYHAASTVNFRSDSAKLQLLGNRLAICLLGALTNNIFTIAGIQKIFEDVVSGIA